MIVALLQLPSFSSARCATASSRGGGWKPKSWYDALKNERTGPFQGTALTKRRDMDRLAVSVADAAFDTRLAERRHYVVLARPL